MVNTTLSRRVPIILAAKPRGYTTPSIAAASISHCESLPAAIRAPLASTVDVDCFPASIPNALEFLTTTSHHEAFVKKFGAYCKLRNLPIQIGSCEGPCHHPPTPYVRQLNPWQFPMHSPDPILYGACSNAPAPAPYPVPPRL